MKPVVRRYLATIGSQGGKASRRSLTPEQARMMVKVREARRAYRTFYARCFWSYAPDYRVQREDIPWVAEHLMKHGGREGWQAGAKLCR